LVFLSAAEFGGHQATPPGQSVAAPKAGSGGKTKGTNASIGLLESADGQLI